MDITNNLPSYRFPILKNQEILECLTDAGIEITSNELMEPNRHKDRVKSIFHDLVSNNQGCCLHMVTLLEWNKLKCKRAHSILKNNNQCDKIHVQHMQKQK